MFILKIILIVEMVASVNCATCSNTSWQYSFKSNGQSLCQESNYFINGLERNDVNWREDPLDHLEGVECCSATSQWSNVDLHVVYTDWTHALDNDNSWAYCPQGYFLQGLYRSKSGWSRKKNYLDRIESARCVKPSIHPLYYGDCYNEDISICFDRKGRCSCKEGYYITGLFRGNGGHLYNLETLRCCTMVDKPQEVENIEELKTRIMDKTLRNMVKLADKLGYGWCGGNRAVFVGEDFERNSYTWEASKKLFWPNKNCNGYRCNQRLSLTFGDWNLAVKEIKYGQSVQDELEPEAVETGTIYNKHSTPVTKSYTLSKTVQETVTHTATSSWSNSNELSLELEFEIQDLAKIKTGYRTTFTYSSSNSTTKSTQNTKTLNASTSKTLEPFTAAKYTVIVSKSRTTISYTAVIIAKFSTEFRGFLRWGQGYGSPTTNYHYQYKGSGDRPTVNYSFGSSSIPFYTALKKESDKNASPWLWNEIFKNYPTARHVINSLTDEAQYEFTLNGTLEQVAGTNIDVFWKTLNITRRDVQVGNTMEVQVSNKTILAVTGPNDRPVHVEYPDVALVNSEPFQVNDIPVDKNSA